MTHRLNGFLAFIDYIGEWIDRLGVFLTGRR